MPRRARLDAPGSLHHVMVSIEELKAGSRRRETSRARARIAIELVKTYGVSLAEAARQLGVSTSGISKIIKRANQ